MAEPLLSLLTPRAMKHVVPWKTRSDFIQVYQDLYSCDVQAQESALGKIAVWRSRAGSKLSVAIDSSASLMEMSMRHKKAQEEGTLKTDEQQLRFSYSMAIIRFVNHVTEKAQTKAVAQPVHLIAREFGIPEWIVRLRHDATHGTLPCLDTLACGAQWCLNYLQHSFWQPQTEPCVQQTEASSAETSRADREGVMHSGKSSKVSVKTADIRKVLSDFQAIRQEKFDSGNDEVTSSHQSSAVSKLSKYLALDRMKFVNCLLEDGVMIATEEQLLTYGVSKDDLMTNHHPSLPRQMALCWRPVLKRLSQSGALPFMLHSALFSVTSDHGLRNTLLVAWLVYILANTTCADNAKTKSRRQKRSGRLTSFMSTAHPIPTRVLLAACLQNLNQLTVHLLRYLLDVESLGVDGQTKLGQLLCVSESEMQPAQPLKEQSDSGEIEKPYTDSDSEADALKNDPSEEETERQDDPGFISTETVQEIQKSFVDDRIQWNVCTDLVDWSVLPFGMLPQNYDSAACEDDTADNPSPSQSARADGDCRRRRRHDDAYDDDDDSDDLDTVMPPKRSKLIVTEDLLI